MAEDKKELRDLIIDGSHYKTRYTPKYEKRRVWEYPDSRKIVSYIPGTVIEQYYKNGDEVKAGEAIMLFEAMKMQTKVYMPYNGIIKKYCVEIGERYPKEHVLVEIE